MVKSERFINIYVYFCRLKINCENMFEAFIEKSLF